MEKEIKKQFSIGDLVRYKIGPHTGLGIYIGKLLGKDLLDLIYGYKVYVISCDSPADYSEVIINEVINLTDSEISKYE